MVGFRIKSPFEETSGNLTKDELKLKIFQKAFCKPETLFRSAADNVGGHTVRRYLSSLTCQDHCQSVT